MNKIKILSIFYLTRIFGGKNKIRKKWTTLEHNGVLFPPNYTFQNIKLIYDNKEISLPPLAEEYALLYSKYIDSEYIKYSQFNKNFWKDWKKTLTPSLNIVTLDKCDFSNFVLFIKKSKEKEKNMSSEIKEKNKELKLLEEEKYKYATIDGVQQPIGNFKIEPPGIFIGRGKHPKIGRIKKRILPEDITLNIGKNAKIPNPPNGHKWGKIIHNQEVEWLASWKDNISDKVKYVWLASTSDLKMKNDQDKFDIARKLKNKIKKIREDNNKNLSSDDIKIKQLATALYFIDKLALRVGNEKNDDEADTVGVTSLRVEHIKLNDNNNIKLDFLGKDSIRYTKELEVDPPVYSNLVEFTKNKNKDDDLFDKINSNLLNKYLQNYMKELTAKVFRTFNASLLFQEELESIIKKYKDYNKPDKINILLDLFNQANAKVACLCNHQKNVSKNYNESIDKINEKIKELTKKKKDSKNTTKIKLMIDKLKRKKLVKKELKNLAIGTSKTSYIDPRITIAFMKTFDLPVNKIFSKILIDKFKWAFDVDQNWRF